MYENQLRQAVEARKKQLIERINSLSVQDDTRFNELTLSELENEWKFYMKEDFTEAN